MLIFILSFVTLASAHPRADCGNYTTKIPLIDSQIVGGENARSGHWPWMASVQRRTPAGNFEHHCGGTLIRANWVLTAANCVPDGESYQVVLGALDLASPDGGEQTIAAQTIIRHENFNPASENRANDVALIQLASNANIVRYRVDVACVPPADLPYEDNPACFITGWGENAEGTRPTILQEAHVDVINNAECDEDLGITGPDLEASQICTSDELNDRKAACSGDEGGPLQCRVDRQWDVVGIASWHGSDGPDCDTESPTIFTRTQSFRQWIHDRVGEPTA
ncbi:unnamed protein product [Owenia fusiformis]|uniref:Uncharacterized protein n=1 Tax=Owenia fusiformis TaxID=6347 RepID=A0A8J1U0X9_OWEFU|nr:unnamed protein product [Owenia fusiformis]